MGAGFFRGPIFPDPLQAPEELGMNAVRRIRDCHGDQAVKSIHRLLAASSRGVTSSATGKNAELASGPLFHDWAKFVAFRPRFYFQPASLDELKNFINGI